MISNINPIHYNRGWIVLKSMAFKIQKMQIISKWQTIKHGSKISIPSQQASILFEQISSKCILILAHWRSNLTAIFAIAKQHFEVCTWKVKYWINSYFTLCLNSTWRLFMNGKHSRSLYFLCSEWILWMEFY